MVRFLVVSAYSVGEGALRLETGLLCCILSVTENLLLGYLGLIFLSIAWRTVGWMVLHYHGATKIEYYYLLHKLKTASKS